MENNKIEIVLGDITDMNVDAIVNAANTDLKLGSGVAGAIRRNGGPSIQLECDKIGSIDLGQAAVTSAGQLKAKYVIHAAAMHLGGLVNEDSLYKTTLNCLRKSSELGIKTLAFPAIGTGVGNFPIDECANIMINTASKFLAGEEISIEKVFFVLFDQQSYQIFQSELES